LEAKRTGVVLQLTSKASRVLLLSGTPALGKPKELYSQLIAVAPDHFPAWGEFARKFCIANYSRVANRWIYQSGGKNLKELNRILQPFMIRRLKKEVLSELPPKRRQRIMLALKPKDTKRCEELIQEYQALAKTNPNAAQALMGELYAETAHAKEDAVCSYVEDLLASDVKFLVFAHHKSMLDAVQAKLEACEVGFMRIDGSVSAVQRQERKEQFQTNPLVRVAILGITAAGVGITLTAAKTVVFAELYWTPGVLEQAEDRAHRIGQKSSVSVQYLIARDTIDIIMWSILRSKVGVVSTMLDGERRTLTAERVEAEEAEFFGKDIAEESAEELSDEGGFQNAAEASAALAFCEEAARIGRLDGGSP